MNVIPNKAMMTVTTADSKYSRITLRGGPAGSAPTLVSTSRPLDRTGRELNAPGFWVVFSVVVMVDSLIADIVEVGKLHGQAGFGSALLTFHLFQRRLCRSRLGSLDGWTLSPRRAVVPLQLNMEHALMWWPQCFDHRVLRTRLTNRLQFFLQSSFRIGRGRGDWISRAKLRAQSKFDKVRRRFQSAVKKNRSGYGFENIRQQGVLAAATTLLFPAPKSNKVSQA